MMRMVFGPRALTPFACATATLLLTACGGDPPRAQPSQGAAGCGARVRFDSGSNQTGGQLVAYFAVTAPPGRRCALSGFPSIRMIDDAGGALTTHVLRRTDVAVRPVVVRRGSPGEFSIVYRFDTPSGRGCRGAAHALLVRLPGDRRTLTVAVGRSGQQHSFAPCGGRLILGPILGEG
jgi:hypothetical protein